MIKVLNLYAGIGGNRKYWKNVEVTSVELNPDIAKIYSDFFPDDKVIITDAHQYLLEHYNEYDFIWSSPPCPSHSHIRKELAVEARKQNKPVYPDMQLYEEILFLQGYCKGLWTVENVTSWYTPLIIPIELNRHYFWCNFIISKTKNATREHRAPIDKLEERKGFNLNSYSNIDKRRILRNCVEPELGLHIFNCAFPENHIHIENYYKQEVLL